MSKKVLVPVADGIEEIEAVTLIDVLRRAGAEVTVASVNGPQITASRGVRMVADCLIGACAGQAYDLVVLPGGMPGAQHLNDNRTLQAILRQQAGQGRLYAAICASPAVVLETQGLLKGKKATTHPNFVDRLSDAAAAAERVVRDGNCLTSRGPGTALEFALQLVEMLYGEERRKAVAAPMVI